MCKAIEDLIADGKEAGKKEGREEGKKEGREEGKEEGKQEGRTEGDATRLVMSAESVMKNLQVEAAKACEIIGVTIEEYQKAKSAYPCCSLSE